MKLLLLFVGCLLMEGFIQWHSPKADPSAARRRALLNKQKNLVNCSVSAATFDLPANPIPVLSGWGDYTMPVTKKNDSAFFYFQQGINMYYGFHIIEALASFDKSTRLDSSFAMGYWGKALAYGPNINDFGYTTTPAALAAAQQAKTLSTGLSPAENALIDTMLMRYSADTSQSREYLDQRYADAMQAAYKRFPRLQDIGALYADALMQQHPWDLYDRFGKPRTWTPPIVATLEDVLRANPAHPGAAHYYIHAVEASDLPERGLAAADRLPSLMPGVSHIVHMPSHIYIRTGNYDRGWQVNVNAVKGYYDYLGKYPAVADNAPLYLGHNLHMKAACAGMDGRYADAMLASAETRASFDSSLMSSPGFMGVFMQYVYMTPLLTEVRFGKWDNILKETQVRAAYVYADLLSHYCRGIAFARKGQATDAEQELAALYRDTGNAQLKGAAPNYANPGINGARVAGKILEGVIAESHNRFGYAAGCFKTAVELEDVMVYDEPKDWQQPARQFLGSVLIRSGQYREAEKAFREDLRINPGNGWSYKGLAIALNGQGRKKEAVAAEEKARKAFVRSDVKITGAVY